MKYITLPAIDNLLPRLSDEEYAQLKQSIQTEGIREPIILWRRASDDVLIDGHNRARVCEELDIVPPVAYHDFDSVESAKQWVLRNQLGRRNLTPDRSSYLRGELALSLGEKTDTLTVSLGVSPRTIYRDKAFARAVDGLQGNESVSKEQILERTRAEVMTLYDMPKDKREEILSTGARVKTKPNILPIDRARRLMRKAVDTFAELVDLADRDDMIGEMMGHIAQLCDDAKDFAAELEPMQEMECHKCNGVGCDYCAGLGVIPGIIVAEQKHRKK